MLDYSDIPHFPVSTAMGHKGRLVCGRFAGKPIVAMQGRFHLYEGYSYEQLILPTQVLCCLGVNKLLVSNAAGGVNPKFLRGEIMLISSHVDFMFRTSKLIAGTSNKSIRDRPQHRSDDCYSEHLMQVAESVGRKNDFMVHRGCYAGMLGPNYETRAEYRMLRRIGGDAAGMSTLPEVTVAAAYGIDVLACSIITNVAKPDVLEPTSGQEVVDAAEVAAPNLHKVFEAILSR